MQNKEWYAQKAKEHFNAYQKAVDEGDTQAIDFNMQEYLTYDKAAKSIGE